MGGTISISIILLVDVEVGVLIPIYIYINPSRKRHTKNYYWEFEKFKGSKLVFSSSRCCAAAVVSPSRRLRAPTFGRAGLWNPHPYDPAPAEDE